MMQRIGGSRFRSDLRASAPPPRPRISRARPDAREHVDESDSEENALGKAQNDKQHDGKQQQDLEGMTSGKVDLLARPEAPGTDHQKAAHPHDGKPDDRDPPGLVRIGSEEMHGRSQQARSGGNRHADEVFSPRPARITRLSIVTDVETRQARRTADEVEKTDEGASMQQVLAQLEVDRVGEEVETPDVSQQARRH